MGWRLLVAMLALGTGACGGLEDLSNDGGGGYGGSGVPCDSGGTVSLGVDPAVVQRGEAVSITVTWRTVYDVKNPKGTLSLSQDAIDVQVSLAADPAGPAVTYIGTLVNPFGLGAPAGAVDVLTAGEPWDGCHYALTGATTFSLE